MLSTSITLLERLRETGDQAAWREFADLYTPLLFHWARKRGLQESDAADLVQDVLLIISQQLPKYRYDPPHRFRGWLRTITVNKLNEFHRRRTPHDRPRSSAELNAAAEQGDQTFWDQEYRQHLFARAVELMQTHFEPATWRAALESIISDRTAREIGEDLGLSEGAVYQSRSRVLRRLRQELDGLWE